MPAAIAVPSLCGISVAVFMMTLLLIPLNVISSEGSKSSFCDFIQEPHNRVKISYNTCLVVIFIIMGIQEFTSKLDQFKNARIALVLLGALSAAGSTLVTNNDTMHSLYVVFTWIFIAVLYTVVALQTFCGGVGIILTWLLLPPLCAILHFLVNREGGGVQFQNKQLSCYAVAVPLMATAIAYTSCFRI